MNRWPQLTLTRRASPRSSESVTQLIAHAMNLVQDERVLAVQLRSLKEAHADVSLSLVLETTYRTVCHSAGPGPQNYSVEPARHRHRPSRRDQPRANQLRHRSHRPHQRSLARHPLNPTDH